MKYAHAGATLIIGIMSTWMPYAATAKQQLTARLVSPYIADKTRSTIVKLTLRNEGDEPVSIYEWDTPFAQAAGRLPKSQFEVRNGAGDLARYVGRSVYTARILADQFIILEPGESIEKDVDLLHEYDFGNGGAFSVKFVLSLDREPDRYVVTPEEYNNFHRNTQKSAESNETVIYVSGPAPKVAVFDGEDCDDSRKTVVADAWRKAFDPIWNARTFLSQRYLRVKQEDGSWKYVFQPHTKYSRWMGDHGPGPNYGDADWASSDNGHILGVSDALLNRLVGGPNQRLIPKCGCPGYPETTPAWAETSTRYLIHFCDSFFALPETGYRASRVGTIIHELSHFADGMEGTADYVYGWDAAQRLAAQDRSKAVRNADNYEYLLMDTTPDTQETSRPPR